MFCYGKLVLSKKIEFSVMSELFVFFNNTFLNIFGFVNESKSLVRKVSAVKKKVLLIKKTVHSYIKGLLHLEVLSKVVFLKMTRKRVA